MDNMEDKSPFELFPKEIWCIILDKVNHIDEITNTIKAFPEMEHLIQKKLWLLGKVLPHLSQYINEKDMLNCRLACRPWSQGVEKFLEDHPSIRAYNHESQDNDNLWSANNSKNYHDEEQTYYSNSYCHRYLNGKIHSFTSGSQLANVIQKMGDHPSERNPFLGRSITLGLSPFMDVQVPKRIAQFRRGTIRFLEKFGGHIWFINIAGDESQDLREFCNSLKRCLSLLPNLKSLRLSGRLKYMRADAEPKINVTFPALPQLETFQFLMTYSGNGQLAAALLRHYSEQIQSLKLNFTRQGSNLLNKFANLLPNLTELKMVGMHIDADDYWKLAVDEILLSLNAPKLHYLQMSSFSKSKFNQFRKIPEQLQCKISREDILRWLRRFPVLKTFQFLHDNISIPHFGLSLHAEDAVTSVRTISIHGASMEVNFLQSFPALQCLYVHFSCSKSLQREKLRFQVCMKCNRQDNVWQQLPKLSTVVLVNAKTGFRQCIDRPI